MIAGCPKCSARYRVDADRIGPDGAKLRCTKCSAVFLVRAPTAKSDEAVAAPAAPAQAPATHSAASSAPSRPETGMQPAASASAEEGTDSGEGVAAPISAADRARLVLVADPDEERAKSSAEAITGWGLLPHIVHDGVEAMLAIQRMLPAAVILDAALPKMFGFQVCEVIKRNESLRETVTVLVGAIHHQERYRRSPTELYGADVYVEQPDLPDGLLPILRESGLPIRGNSDAAPAAGGDASPAASSTGVQAEQTLDLPVSDPAPEPQADDDFVGSFSPPPEAPPEVAPPAMQEAVAPPAAAPPAAAASAVANEDPERVEERERAERLARIAVSEMVLYQPEKFDRAAREGNLETVLDMEISEARALLRQRISEEVRAETDFVMDELVRVAQERRAQG